MKTILLIPKPMKLLLLLFLTLPTYGAPKAAEVLNIDQFIQLDRFDLAGKTVMVEVKPSALSNIRSSDNKAIIVSLAGWNILFPRSSKERLQELSTVSEGFAVVQLKFPDEIDVNQKTPAIVEKVYPTTSISKAPAMKARNQANDPDASPRPDTSQPIAWREYEQKRQAGEVDNKVFMVRFRAADVIANNEMEKELRPTINGPGVSFEMRLRDGKTVVFEVPDADGVMWLQERINRRNAAIDVYTRFTPGQANPKIIGNWFQPQGAGAAYSFR